jgi:hypothetical protein
MFLKNWSIGTMLVIGALAVGCGKATTTPSPQTATAPAAPSPAGKDILLAEQPADAKPVADVRESAEDGVDVTVMGRIGGGETPWVFIPPRSRSRPPGR